MTKKTECSADVEIKAVGNYMLLNNPCYQKANEMNLGITNDVNLGEILLLAQSEEQAAIQLLEEVGKKT
ncbi:hypothetical protein GCM10020331_079760 [Ectobacillus funiculus]